MKTLYVCITIGVLSLISGSAFAQNEGSIKVECWGQCNLVNLGQICDTFSANSNPVAVACDDTTDQGGGLIGPCGSVSCQPYGSLWRSDLLSSYCADGPGFDAVVTCRPVSGYVPSLSDKQDEGYEPRGGSL